MRCPECGCEMEQVEVFPDFIAWRCPEDMMSYEAVKAGNPTPEQQHMYELHKFEYQEEK